MHRMLALAMVAFLVAGCSGTPGERTPASEEPTTAAGTDAVPNAEAPEPPAAGGVRVEEHEGNLTFEQTAAVVCPYYVEGAARSTTLALDLTDATAFDFAFDWVVNPDAPTFQGAIMGLSPAGTSVGSEDPLARGRSVLQWRLDAAALANLDGEWFLHIVGPDCPEDSAPLQSGVDYTQVIHYRGNVTYPA